MRYMYYFVMNKNTGKKMHISFSEKECREYIKAQTNQEELAVGHYWKSI